MMAAPFVSCGDVSLPPFDVFLFGGPWLEMEEMGAVVPVFSLWERSAQW